MCTLLNELEFQCNQPQKYQTCTLCFLKVIWRKYYLTEAKQSLRQKQSTLKACKSHLFIFMQILIMLLVSSPRVSKIMKKHSDILKYYHHKIFFCPYEMKFEYFFGFYSSIGSKTVSRNWPELTEGWRDSGRDQYKGNQAKKGSAVRGDWGSWANQEQAIKAGGHYRSVSTRREE